MGFRRKFTPLLFFTFFIAYGGITYIPPIGVFPFKEDFEACLPPVLPPGWTTSFYRGSETGDFITEHFQDANRLSARNATIEQYIHTPVFDFTGYLPETLSFTERRSGTFMADIRVSAIIGDTETLEIGTSLPGNPNVFELTSFPLPSSLTGAGKVRFEWRILPDSAGAAGTLRIDDIRIEAGKQYRSDLAVSSVTALSEKPKHGEPVQFQVTLENRGLIPAANFTLNIYRCSMKDSGEFVLIASHDIKSEISPSASLESSFTLTDLPPGYVTVRTEIVYAPDDNPSNNIYDLEISVGFPRGAIIVNEILYHVREGQCEFVEILNLSGNAVDLKGWTLRDRKTPAGNVNEYLLSDSSLVLGPGKFTVLAANQSINIWFGGIRHDARLIIAGRTALGLSSAGDIISLYDPNGGLVDSVAYEPSWHHPDVIDTRGRSLERISPLLDSNDPSNWSTTAAPLGGTPGEKNSLYAETPVPSGNIAVSPNPFSPNASGIDDHTVIAYSLPSQTAMVRLRIFDSLGRPIRTLLDNRLSGPDGRVIWDGRNDNGRVVRLGIYIVYLEAYDDNRSGLIQLKSTVVVADRL